MCKEKGNGHEREVEEKFDRFVKKRLLEEANRLRKEKGLPLLTEEDMAGLDGSKAPEDEGNA